MFIPIIILILEIMYAVWLFKNKQRAMKLATISSFIIMISIVLAEEIFIPIHFSITVYLWEFNIGFPFIALCFYWL